MYRIWVDFPLISNCETNPTIMRSNIQICRPIPITSGLAFVKQSQTLNHMISKIKWIKTQGTKHLCLSVAQHLKNSELWQLDLPLIFLSFL